MEGFGAQAVRVGAGPEALARGGWRESRRSSHESRKAGSSAEWQGGHGNQSRWQSRAAPWAAAASSRASEQQGGPAVASQKLRSVDRELRSLSRSVKAKEALPYDSMHVRSGMYLIIVFR